MAATKALLTINWLEGGTLDGSNLPTAGYLGYADLNGGSLSGSGVAGNTAGSGNPFALLTFTQLTAALNQFTSSLQGLVPGSGGGTSNFLRADGSWAAPSGGMSNPMTALGDMIYGGVVDGTSNGTPERLAFNTSYLPLYLQQIGNGGDGSQNAPSWQCPWPVPPTPTSLAAGTITSTTIAVSCTIDAAAGGVVWFYCPSSEVNENYPWTLAFSDDPVQGSSVTITGLTPDTSYYIVACATNGALGQGLGPWASVEASTSAGGLADLWASDSSAKIWKVTTSGSGTSYSLTGANGQAVCAGPDGNVWVADENSAVWKVDPSTGSGTKYTLSGGGGSGITPQGICAGSDGNLWVADSGAGSGSGGIWQITTGGSSTFFGSFAAPPIDPSGICSGPDDNLWVIDNDNQVIYVVDTSGSLVNTVSMSGASLNGICAGQDGNVWVADGSGNVWQITPSTYVTTQYALSSSQPTAVCAGPDDNLWVADGNGAIWKVDYSTGSGTSYAATGYQDGICVGPDGSLWASTASTGVCKCTTGGTVTPYTLSSSNPTGIT